MRPIVKLPATTVGVLESADTLRHLLLEAVGPYCAYCESPLTTDFPWAHKISVSDQAWNFDMGGKTFRYSAGVKPRRFRAAWLNQHTICWACAAAKAEAPGSAEGFQYLLDTNRGRFDALTAGAPGTLSLGDDQADDLYYAAFQTWVWPDVASDENGLTVLPGDPTYDLFTYELSSRTQLDLMQHRLVRLTDEEQDEDWASTAQNKVWVIPNDGFIDQQADAEDLRRRVHNTILGLNLNYANSRDPRASDRRVDNRTAALETINLAILHLTQVVQQVHAHQQGGDEELEHRPVVALLDVIRETLRATGFWSLWAKRFEASLIGEDDDDNEDDNDDDDDHSDVDEDSDDDEINAVWRVYSRTARRLFLYDLLIEYEIDLRQIGEIRTSRDAPMLDNASIDEIISRMVLPGTDVERLPF